MESLAFPLFFFVDVFSIGFCRHLPLLALLIVIAALVLGQVGSGYGVRWLVRHQDPGKQFVVGMAMAILFLKVLFVGFLLETARNQGAVSESEHTLRGLLDRYPNWSILSPLWTYILGLVVSFLGLV